MSRPQQPVVASATRAEVVNLAADTPKGYSALYIGVTGNVVVDLADGDTNVTFSNVPVGFFPVSVSKVYSTGNGTTAGSILGLKW